MPRQAAGTMIPDDFGFKKHPELRAWTEREFPALDAEATMTRFIEYAEDAGRLATKWTACYKRIVRTGVENSWKGICVYKSGELDPKWQAILKEVQPYGFRKPYAHETPGAYRTAFDLWSRNERKGEKVISIRKFA